MCPSFVYLVHVGDVIHGPFSGVTLFHLSTGGNAPANTLKEKEGKLVNMDVNNAGHIC